jgi:hypothetical protein
MSKLATSRALCVGGVVPYVCDWKARESSRRTLQRHLLGPSAVDQRRMCDFRIGPTENEMKSLKTVRNGDETAGLDAL